MTDKTDFQKAREAAVESAQRMQWQAERNGHNQYDAMALTIDAALSAFSAAGWELVPAKPWPSMIDAGNDELDRHDFPEVWAGETYEAMIQAALKERQT